MRGTFTLPSGRKVRTASERRYVLIGNDTGAARILARSDSSGTIRAKRTAARRRSSNMNEAFFIIDTNTGETIQ